MAAEPAVDLLYRALRSADADPDLAHGAVEEIREMASQKVIDAISVQIMELRAEMDMRFAELKSENAEMRAEIQSQGARIESIESRIESIESRIEDLRQVIWRVVWPLIVLLAAPIFGLLYKALAS